MISSQQLLQISSVTIMHALGGYGMWHVFYVAQVPEIAMQGAICLAGAIAIFCARERWLR